MGQGPLGDHPQQAEEGADRILEAALAEAQLRVQLVENENACTLGGALP
jgi:hypothetical protein